MGFSENLKKMYEIQWGSGEISTKFMRYNGLLGKCQ